MHLHAPTISSFYHCITMFLRFSLRSANEQLEIYKRKLDALDDYERQICLLREEVSFLSTEKAMLQERYTCMQCTHAICDTPQDQENISLAGVALVCSSVFHPQVSEESFFEPLVQAQPVLQPKEERVPHPSAAH